eukprot:321638-Amphidinium_carterae.1
MARRASAGKLLPHLFDVVEYLNPEREAQCRANPDKPHRKYVPVLKETDCVTIGCNSVLHADSSQPPISSAEEKVIQIIPAGSYLQRPRTSNCIIQPIAEQGEYMTWHDRGEGNHNPEQRLPPAFAYHSGTILTVLSILRCRKYLPQCYGHSIFAGRTYP